LHICVIGINDCGLLQCALWEFNGGEIEWGNPYKAIHVDMFHQAYLGVFKTIIDILWGIALASINSKILSSLDQRLFHIKKHSRYPSFRIHGPNKGGYFSSNANFAAFEHRSVMQVLSIPHLVSILVGAF
jgi:hypothetical protein